MSVMLDNALREIAELRKDADVFVKMYKQMTARIREQEHIPRERPLHAAPEAQALMGALELCVWSLDTRINEYKQAVLRLQDTQEEVKNGQSARLHLVSNLDEYRNRRGDSDGGSDGTS